MSTPAEKTVVPVEKNAKPCMAIANNPVFHTTLLGNDNFVTALATNTGFVTTLLKNPAVKAALAETSKMQSVGKKAATEKPEKKVSPKRVKALSLTNFHEACKVEKNVQINAFRDNLLKPALTKAGVTELSSMFDVQIADFIRTTALAHDDELKEQWELSEKDEHPSLKEMFEIDDLATIVAKAYVKRHEDRLAEIEAKETRKEAKAAEAVKKATTKAEEAEEKKVSPKKSKAAKAAKAAKASDEEVADASDEE
jgi:hypothetical protein